MSPLGPKTRIQFSCLCCFVSLLLGHGADTRRAKSEKNMRERAGKDHTL